MRIILKRLIILNFSQIFLTKAVLYFTNYPHSLATHSLVIEKCMTSSLSVALRQMKIC